MAEISYAKIALALRFNVTGSRLNVSGMTDININGE